MSRYSDFEEQYAHEAEFDWYPRLRLIEQTKWWDGSELSQPNQTKELWKSTMHNFAYLYTLLQPHTFVKTFAYSSILLLTFGYCIPFFADICMMLHNFRNFWMIFYILVYFSFLVHTFTNFYKLLHQYAYHWIFLTLCFIL